MITYPFGELIVQGSVVKYLVNIREWVDMIPKPVSLYADPLPEYQEYIPGLKHKEATLTVRDCAADSDALFEAVKSLISGQPYIITECRVLNSGRPRLVARLMGA